MNNYQQHLQIAVALSLLLHSMLFGAYQLQRHFPAVLGKRAVSKQAAAAAMEHKSAPTITFIEAPPAVPAPKKESQPQIFMETDERQVAKEQAVTATPYYSDKTTIAMNPENLAKAEGDTPYLDGNDSKMLSTENVPVPTPGALALSQKRVQQARQVAQPATPATAPAAPKPVEVPPAGVRTAEPVAKQTMAMATGPLARPTPPAAPQEATEPPTRPGVSVAGRELAAGKADLRASGTSRKGIAAFNVASSPFGEYDRKLIREVQQRWYMIIDKLGVYEKAGTVTIYFQLSDDGAISNLRRKENTAGEILALWCEKAITDSAPFDPLTDDLRRLVGNEPREVNFTFYY